MEVILVISLYCGGVGLVVWGIRLHNARIHRRNKRIYMENHANWKRVYKSVYNTKYKPSTLK
jgi:hypothetical protein